jgi:ribosomal-protein-alanine N-acetyltransferase
MNDTLIYRKAICDDVIGIHRVEASSFLLPWSLRAIYDDVCNNESSMYVVAVCTAHIVGFCGVHYILDEGHITNVAVLNDFRRQGIGKKLVQTMFDLSPSYIDKFTLEVRVSNRTAINIYRSLGFKSFGVRPNYYGDNGEDALIMWRNIRVH